MTRCDLCLLVGVLLVLHPGALGPSVPERGRPAEAPSSVATAPAPPAISAAPPTTPASVTVPARSTVKVAAPKPRPGAADAARVLRRINPALSADEAERIGEAVVRHGARYRLDPELVLAVILVESGARPSVVSPEGALGLMQVMPAHFERLGLPGDGTHIERNVQAGCSILARNIARHGEERGILAYYWGDDIRGDAYLGKVRAAQAKVRARLSS